MATLQEQLDAVEAELRSIHEAAGDEALDADTQTRWDTLVAERGEAGTADKAGTGLREAIRVDAERRATVRSLAERPGRVESGDGATGAPQVMQRVTPFDGGDVRTMPRGEVRDKALAVLESRDHTRHLDTDQLDQVDKLLRRRSQNFDGTQLARMMLLTETEDYRNGWQKLVTQTQPVLTAEEARAINAYTEYRGMLGGTDTAGGYGVPVLIDPTIILTAQGSLNPFRRLARVEPITTDKWNGVSSAGVTWSYDSEASAVSDDSPTLAQPTVDVHEARGFIRYSIRVGEDYPGFAAEMSMLLSEGYDELEAQAFATGSGSGQPFGIITALDANTNVEVTPTTDGAFGGVDINKVWGALPDRYKANATWVMNHDVGGEVASFGNGNNLSFVTVDLTGVLETIRKRPVEYSSYFPDFTGTTGASNILVVGDFRNYLIVERVGMSVELVPHLFDTSTGRPTGERGWYARARHGADSINDLGFRLLQNQ